MMSVQLQRASNNLKHSREEMIAPVALRVYPYKKLRQIQDFEFDSK